MLLIAVAAGGLATGFLVYRRAAGPASVLTASAPSPAATAPGAPGAVSDATGGPAEAAAPAAPIPEAVPDVVLQDMAGRRRALRDASGHPHLYNFWATWCEPCRREIPLLNTLQGAYRADRLQVVGIAVDFRDSVRDFLKAQPLHYSLLIGEEDGLEAAQKFGMELNLPFSVFADGQNRIIAVKVGELHRAEADAILQAMRDLQAGRVSLAQARSGIAAALKALALERAKQSGPKGAELSH